MNNRKAFTLIELSIVMIVISLLIAGIFLATNILRKSRIRSAINESSEYITAINSFKYQYNYYPGDMPNATNFLPGSTINGNGNFLIQWSGETFRSWQHLVLADMINFNWKSTASEPSSKYGNTIWRIESTNYKVYTNAALSINSIGLTGCGKNNTADCNAPSPIDAYEIDSKIDDGNPATGKIITIVNGTGCIKNLSGSYINSTYYANTDVVYNLLNANFLCSRIMFVI